MAMSADSRLMTNDRTITSVPTPAAAATGRAKPRSLGLAAWLIPSLADVLFLATLGFILGLRAHQLFNADGDLARHLAVGRQILADGAVPTVDLFSHTKGGEPFVPYEWLSEVTFAFTYRQLEMEGVAVLAASLAALPFLLLARWMVRDGTNMFITLLLVVAGGLATSLHWLARPHLFTILLALLWTRTIVDYRETGRLRHLIALPPMMALWANLHGGFLVGFVILGVFLLSAAAERIAARGKSQGPGAGTPNSIGPTHHSSLSTNSNLQPLALAGLVSLAAVGLNPVGYALLPHVLSYFRHRLLVDNTVEYLSPNFHDLGPQLFAGLLLLAVASLAAIPRRVSLAEVALMAIWTFFALYSARNIPLFVVICLPTVGRLATEAFQALTRSSEGDGVRKPGLAARLAATERMVGRPLLPTLGIVLAMLVTSGGLGELRPTVGFDPKAFPVQALPRAEELNVRGNLFNHFPWGGYILFAGYPKHRVFIDGQTDLYGEDLTRDYMKVVHLEPDWETVLDRYQIGWILIPHQSPLSLLLARTPGWRLSYQDETADIFVREERQ